MTSPLHITSQNQLQNHTLTIKIFMDMLLNKLHYHVIFPMKNKIFTASSSLTKEFEFYLSISVVLILKDLKLMCETKPSDIVLQGKVVG